MIVQGHHPTPHTPPHQGPPPKHTPTHPGHPPKPGHKPPESKPPGHKPPSTKPTHPKPPSKKTASRWEIDVEGFGIYPLPGLKQGGHIH